MTILKSSQFLATSNLISNIHYRIRKTKTTLVKNSVREESKFTDHSNVYGSHTTPDRKKRNYYTNYISKRKSVSSNYATLTPRQQEVVPVESNPLPKTTRYTETKKSVSGSNLNPIRRPRKVRKQKQERPSVTKKNVLFSVVEEQDDPQPETGTIPFDVLFNPDTTQSMVNSSIEIKNKNADLLEELDSLKKKLKYIFKSISKPTEDS
jgi:hypothetical protein